MGDTNNRIRVVAGAPIFREGEAGRTAYVIESGRVEITARKRGETLHLAHLGPGEVFGELALLDESLRTATATAVEDTELSVITRDYLDERLDKADPLLNLLLGVLVDRFRVTHRVRLLGEDSIPPSTERRGRISNYEMQRVDALRELHHQHELEAALTDEQLRLHYQPIVDLRSGDLAGFEALMRWQHPERGMVPPVEFIPFAERTGVMVAMGLWALREAPIVLRRFQAAHLAREPGAAPLRIGVNVSGCQLADLRDVDSIIETLTSSGIDLPNVQLEITESLLMDDPQQAASSLKRLREVGVQLSIDDFGTGYSSLSYLHRFPIDSLKIDRSFVDAMLRDPVSMKIVRSIVALARDIGLTIVAEGIETQEQLAALRALGCDYGQGYLISRPLPAADVVALIEAGIELP